MSSAYVVMRREENAGWSSRRDVRCASPSLVSSPLPSSWRVAWMARPFIVERACRTSVVHQVGELSRYTCSGPSRRCAIRGWRRAARSKNVVRCCPPRATAVSSEALLGPGGRGIRADAGRSSIVMRRSYPVHARCDTERHVDDDRSRHACGRVGRAGGPRRGRPRHALEGSRPLSDRVGGPVYLKCENLQRAGSFKIRGAYLRISRLTEEQRRHGVVAASGNGNAQGVALAASLLGTTATVFMPSGAPLPKLEATRAYGATSTSPATPSTRRSSRRRHAEQTGAVLIHPFDHPDIVAGQGTLGLEIVEQCPDVRTVVVCTGGGGLLAGTAVAVRSLRPDAKIVGVQAEGAAAYPPSLAAGRPVPLPGMATMADGIAVGRPGDLPFALVCDHVDDVVTVSEESLSRALLLCLGEAKLVVEPAGAAAVAAVMDRPWEFDRRSLSSSRAATSIHSLMLRVLRHGLAAAGRYQAVHVGCRTARAHSPACYRRAETDANVLDVVHARVDPRPAPGRGRCLGADRDARHQHLDEVMARLRGVGYVVTSG